MKLTHLLQSLALLVVFSGMQAATRAVEPAPPATMPLPFDWYPESVAIGPDGSFYVGSWRQGAVARLRPGATEPEIFVRPGSNGLANGQGVLVDASANLLWICSGTMGFTTVQMTPSALKSYDLATGAPRGSYPMPDEGYCNDLAQDSTGDLYVTDSLHPRVLRLSRGATALDIWKQDTALGTDAGFFLNGIALDGARHVYVSTVMAAPYLLRIDIGDGGEAGAVIRIVAPRRLKNADAIRFHGDDRLVIFESNAFGNDGPYGGAITIARIKGDRMTSLEPLVSGLNDPSSGVIVGDRIYFIESKYPLLLRHKGDEAAIPSNVPFDIQSQALPGNGRAP